MKRRRKGMRKKGSKSGLLTRSNCRISIDLKLPSYLISPSPESIRGDCVEDESRVDLEKKEGTAQRRVWFTSVEEVSVESSESIYQDKGGDKPMYTMSKLKMRVIQQTNEKQGWGVKGDGESFQKAAGSSSRSGSKPKSKATRSNAKSSLIGVISSSRTMNTGDFVIKPSIVMRIRTESNKTTINASSSRLVGNSYKDSFHKIEEKNEN